jgi:hypothetical protein
MIDFHEAVDGSSTPQHLHHKVVRPVQFRDFGKSSPLVALRFIFMVIMIILV